MFIKGQQDECGQLRPEQVLRLVATNCNQLQPVAAHLGGQVSGSDPPPRVQCALVAPCRLQNGPVAGGRATIPHQLGGK